MKWLAIVASLVLVQTADAQSRTLAPHAPRQEELSFRQLDVGQGDAALITTPEGRRILIDAGPDAHLVAGILRKEGIDTLDLVVASHAHADHIGGMPSVFQAVTVRAYMDNGVVHTTATYARTIAAAEREPGLQYLAAIDRTITLGSVRIRVLPPPRTHRSQNNNSVGLLIEYDRFRALYTGDSEQRELAHWLRETRIPPVTLVKAAHHGARNGVTAQWVEATAPGIVLIPVDRATGTDIRRRRLYDSGQRQTHGFIGQINRVRSRSRQGGTAALPCIPRLGAEFGKNDKQPLQGIRGRQARGKNGPTRR